MKTLSSLQIILCLTTVLLASCAPKAPASTETPQTAIEITSFPSRLKIDGINIEFSGYRADDQFLTIDICFDPPSDEIWFFGDTTLKIKDKKLLNGGISRNPLTDRPDGFECEALMYMNDSVIPSGKVDLSIGRLGALIERDVWDCDTAQKHLDEDKTGIVVTCDPTIVGQSGFRVLEKPQTMSDDEASEIALDAFSYSHAIRLNWRFSFLIENP